MNPLFFSEFSQLNIIQSNELYNEILDLVKSTKTGSIQYIGVVGRHNWSPVLSKLLDKRSDEALHEADKPIIISFYNTK
jgi:hypothetical protein